MQHDGSLKMRDEEPHQCHLIFAKGGRFFSAYRAQHAYNRFFSEDNSHHSIALFLRRDPIVVELAPQCDFIRTKDVTWIDLPTLEKAITLGEVDVCPFVVVLVGALIGQIRSECRGNTKLLTAQVLNNDVSSRGVQLASQFFY